MPISREVEITETVVLLGRLMPAALKVNTESEIM